LCSVAGSGLADGGYRFAARSTGYLEDKALVQCSNAFHKYIFAKETVGCG